MRVVDEGETGALAASELGPEAVNDDVSAVALVLLGELFTELLLGDVGELRVDHVQQHLLTGKQLVRQELAGTHDETHMGREFFRFEDNYPLLKKDL